MVESGIAAKITRSDKYQLSGGKLMFAPRYPRWLEAPGWWDGVFYHDEELGPLFTWTILENGSEAQIEFMERIWRPGHSISVYKTATGLCLKEKRLITLNDRIVSQIFIDGIEHQPRTLDLLAWTRLPYSPDLPRPRNIKASRDGISFQFEREGRRGEFITHWELSADRRADSFAVADAECLGPNPEWSQTPFATAWGGSLANATILNEASRRGAVWFAGHYRIRPSESDLNKRTSSSGEQGAVSLAFGLRLTDAARTATASVGVLREEEISKTARSWESFFAGVPNFTCSEPLWEHLYRYRWYLIRQCLKTGDD